MGGLNKIQTEVLVNKIQRFMEKIISQSQIAFVEGRQILDAVLIANEVMDSILRRGESSLVYKLDIEKAYNHLS